MKLALAAALLSSLVACGDDPKTLQPSDPADLQKTLDALAAFGQKQPGTPAGPQAAAYVGARIRALGLTDVHEEMFTVPAWTAAKQFSVTIDGVDMAPGFDVFEASGSGTID